MKGSTRGGGDCTGERALQRSRGDHLMHWSSPVALGWRERVVFAHCGVSVCIWSLVHSKVWGHGHARFVIVAQMYYRHMHAYIWYLCRCHRWVLSHRWKHCNGGHETIHNFHLECFKSIVLGQLLRTNFWKEININMARGYPNMLANLDYMHWTWKNYFVAWYA